MIMRAMVLLVAVAVLTAACNQSTSPPGPTARTSASGQTPEKAAGGGY